MRKLLLTLILVFPVMGLLGCSEYSSYRIKQTSRLKQSHSELIKRALDKKLIRLEFESSLQSYDTAMIEEQSKKGEGLEELKAELDAETAKMIEEVFPAE